MFPSSHFLLKGRLQTHTLGPTSVLQLIGQGLADGALTQGAPESTAAPSCNPQPSLHPAAPGKDSGELCPKHRLRKGGGPFLQPSFSVYYLRTLH